MPLLSKNILTILLLLLIYLPNRLHYSTIAYKISYCGDLLLLFRRTHEPAIDLSVIVDECLSLSSQLFFFFKCINNLFHLNTWGTQMLLYKYFWPLETSYNLTIFSKHIYMGKEHVKKKKVSKQQKCCCRN